MASNGTTSDGLPKRDKVQGKKDIQEELKREQQVGWEVGDHTARPHHPDGWQPGGR